MKQFKELEIGKHFRFATVPKGKSYDTYRLVGIKKTNKEYRMAGLNRIVQTEHVKVIETTDPLN